MLVVLQGLDYGENVLGLNKRFRNKCQDFVENTIIQPLLIVQSWHNKDY